MNADLDQAVATVIDQFRAIKARNPRWSLTSIPAQEIADQFGITREDAIALRELAFAEVTPRLVELIGEQRKGRGADLSQRVNRSGCAERLAITQSAWLANPHVTVEEISRLTGAHPTTARSYLRQLRAASLTR